MHTQMHPPFIYGNNILVDTTLSSGTKHSEVKDFENIHYGLRCVFEILHVRRSEH